MRIAHLSTRLDFYGGEICLANLARGLADAGHQVSCLVRPGSALARRLAAESVNVVEMPLVDWFDPGTIRRVRTWLRAQGIEILATHLPRDYFIAAVASWGLPVCNVATRHVLKPISWPGLKRPFLRRFGAVVAVSEAVAGVVHESGLVPRGRVVTVANGIADPVAVPPPLGLRCRAGVAPQSPVVGFVGRLTPAKGPDVLLKAAAHLLVRIPDLQVFLVGSAIEGSDYLAALQRMAVELGLAGHVHFFGYLPDAARYGREFDIQVVASVAEPFGLVTLEAMANGVPVIATAAGGSSEIVRDGVEGFLVPPTDWAALANRLECLLASPGLRREMGYRGQTSYRCRFTVDRMIAETASVYRQALAIR